MALDWLPIAPDLVPHRRDLQPAGAAAQPPWNRSIFQPVDLLHTTWFLPASPDRVPHTLSIVETSFRTSEALLGHVAVGPLSWLPIYPSSVPHAPLPIVSGIAEPPPSLQPAIALRLAWLPTIPMPLRAPQPQPPPLNQPWSIPPSSLVTTAICAAFGLPAGATTDLLREGLTVTDLVGEGLASTALIGETLC